MAYKKKFDNELILRITKETYAQAEYEPTMDDVIPF